MIIGRRSGGPLGLLLVLALVVTACASNETDVAEAPEEPEDVEQPEPDEAADIEDVELLLAHAAPPDFIYNVVSEHFAERVDELSDGTVSVRISGGAELGDDVSLLDLYSTGDIDVGFNFAPAAGTVIPALGVFGMPFLFEDVDHWERVMPLPEVHEYLRDLVEEADVGFRLGTYGNIGPRSIYTRDLRIESMDDLQGLDVRLPESPIASPVWREIGVNPVALPFPDVYSGLQTGLVEASENAPSSYLTVAHHEVAPIFNVTEHEIGHTYVFVSTATYESLAPSQQAAVDQALQEAGEFWVEEARRQEAEAVERFPELGVELHEPPPEVREEIRSIVEPMHKDIAEDLGVLEFLETVNEHR